MAVGTVALAFSAGAAPVHTDVAAAAVRFYPAVKWQAKSALAGDFSCRGKKELALLGTSAKEIVVAIFLHGLAKPPILLKYSTEVRNPASAVLTSESMDYDPAKAAAEDMPQIPGMEPSKTCLGLNMSDQRVDSAHIYWNRKTHRFEDWSR